MVAGKRGGLKGGRQIGQPETDLRLYAQAVGGCDGGPGAVGGQSPQDQQRVGGGGGGVPTPQVHQVVITGKS